MQDSFGEQQSMFSFKPGTSRHHDWAACVGKFLPGEAEHASVSIREEIISNCSMATRVRVSTTYHLSTALNKTSLPLVHVSLL